MNWIDGYCSESIAYECGQKEEELAIPLSQPTDDAPFYLRYLQARLRQCFPHFSSSIFSSPAEELSAPMLGLLDRFTHHHFQFWAEVVLSEESQSILIRSGLLFNGVAVAVSGRQAVVMAARAANNLNHLLTPIKLTLNTRTGSLALVHCCYIDAEFAKLHSPKNINYLALKVVFVLNTLIAHQPLLLFLLNPHHHLDSHPHHHLYHHPQPHLYSHPQPHLNSHPHPLAALERAQEQAKAVLVRVESSLELMQVEMVSGTGQLQVSRKKESMLGSLTFLDSDIEAILPMFMRPVGLRASGLSRLANEHYSAGSLQEYTTPLEQRLNFRICSRIHLSDYRLIRWQELTEGGFARVELAEVRLQLEGEGGQWQSRVTRKSDKASGMARVKREKAILGLLRGNSHPNIVSCLETDSPDDADYLFSLYEENNSVSQLLGKNLDVSLLQKVGMLLQAAKGLRFLHTHGILHVDFKPANLILGKKYLLKICDFGQSCPNLPLQRTEKFGITLPFAGPEVFQDRKILGEATDVYALGVTIYWCIWGRHLWSVANKAHLRLRLRKGEVSTSLLPEECWTTSCPRVGAILTFVSLRCVKANPRQRPPLAWVITVLEECRHYLQLLHFS